jgi:hypothetical protein
VHIILKKVLSLAGVFMHRRIFLRIALLLCSSYVFSDRGPQIDPTGFSKPPLIFNMGNLTGKLQIKYKPESFYAKNANLVNNANEADRIMFSRSTFDFNVGLDYGKEYCGEDILNFYGTMRNKAVWGDPQSIARTTETSIKLLDVVTGEHKHFISKQIVWIRELWLKGEINKLFNAPFKYQHYMTVGAFPFELGRGISLGAAFAVNPGPLGFFSDNSIDQFAFGYKLGGQLFENFYYDLYGAILDNKAVSLDQTGKNIYGQRYAYFENPERGSGHINYVAAGRIKWFPRQDEKVTSVLEPYFMVNHVPETQVDFPADSKGKLGTVGLAGDFLIGNFEFGFDGARNLGGQTVFGWDRNRVEAINRDALFTIVYSDVVTADPLTVSNPPKALYDTSSTNGKEVIELVEQSSRSQDESDNGRIIGSVGGVDYYNSKTRFRDQYRNKLKGWMIVADGAYWFHDRQLRVACGGGVASGDENPNLNVADPNDSNVDRDYKGFIGLQEIYTGNRIQSVFLLGGVGRVPRLLSPPNARNVTQKFPSKTSGFTNLIFTGASLYWTPKWCQRRIDIRPNVLSYWQQHKTKKFNALTKLSSTEFARTHIGVEVNSFVSLELVKDFQVYGVGSAFVPGDFYKDVKGTPLNKAQQAILDRADVTGADVDNLPLLGDDVAWTVNFGLEYRF